MLYREIIAVCSQIHTNNINTLCGQNVELLNVKLVAHNVTSGPCKVNSKNKTRPMAEHATCKTEANGKNSRYSKPHVLSNALELIHGELRQTVHQTRESK